ncbi:hypothetical protein [Mycobacterium sp. Aquia_213]|uniref:bestrophin-like domain n=1 Tax=Mycobacterium sp. Aquia_213 TaxID=2991728 RepID=UPI00226F80F3|nr:hypothetical protein [Mycobacterium sp. Aquia_213]WAC91877.1 hypothetical protein LMQ14_01210 [Mycobacterium sp. Aquia_213]
MSGWLVSNVPSWLLLVGLNVLIAGGAVLALKYVRQRFPGARGDERSEVTQFAFMLVGFVYAFFTGFIVTAMWGQDNTADDDMRVEGATAVQMASDLTVFDKPDGDRIRAALLDYERAAVTEWPLVAHGGAYPAAGQALLHLRSAYDQVQPRTDTQKTYLATSFDSLHKISQARTERTIRARTDNGMPWSMWTVFFLTSGLVLGGALVYGVEKPAIHYALVATVGVLLATDGFLVVELAHPYLGDTATSSESLGAAIQSLSAPPA